jgi:hypothetical protein
MLCDGVNQGGTTPHNFRFSRALPLTGEEVADYPNAKYSAHGARTQLLRNLQIDVHKS